MIKNIGEKYSKKVLFSDGRCYGYTLQERFETKFKVNEENSCWEWIASLTKYGYGSFGIGKNRVLLAHRVSYKIYKGDPSDLLVCHACDNPKCVNPEHLFLGTHKDNTTDSVNKGRFMSEKRKETQKTLWETRRKNNPDSGKQELVHPSLSAYLNRGCRCNECIVLYKAKGAIYKKRYMDKLKAKNTL